MTAPGTNQNLGEAIDTTSLRLASTDELQQPEAASELQDPFARQATRMAIKNDGRILFINLSDVIAVEAQGNYVLLQRESGSFRLRESISELAERLKYFGFVRIHRSALVNRAWVEEIRPCMGGEYLLRLTSGREFSVTRTYKKNLEALAELWLGNELFADN